MSAIADHTARSKSDPSGTASGTSNSEPSPEKYRRSCAAVSTSTGDGSSETGCRPTPPKCSAMISTSSAASPKVPIGVGTSIHSAISAVHVVDVVHDVVQQVPREGADREHG